jgi:iron complex transport system substrate-binding protein
VTRRPRAGIALAALLASLAAAGLPAAADPRLVVDAAGRQVAVPTMVTRVFAAGRPASIFLYTLAPEKLLGWNRRLNESRLEQQLAALREVRGHRGVVDPSDVERGPDAAGLRGFRGRQARRAVTWIVAGLECRTPR